MQETRHAVPRERSRTLEAQALGGLDLVHPAARPRARVGQLPGRRAGRDGRRRRRPDRRPLPRGAPGDPVAAGPPGAGGRRPADRRGAAAHHPLRRADGRPVREHRQAGAAVRATRRPKDKDILDAIERMGQLARSQVSQAKEAFAGAQRRARPGPRPPGRGDQPAQPRDLPARGRRSATTSSCANGRCS